MDVQQNRMVLKTRASYAIVWLTGDGENRSNKRPKIRRRTRPTLTSKIRRLESKRRGAESKRVRGPVHPCNE